LNKQKRKVNRLKRFKSIAALIAIAAIVGFVCFETVDTFAKGGSSSSSSSRSSSSFSSSRSSSSSYSKPSLPSSSSGYSKPTVNTWGNRSGNGVVSKPSSPATSSGYTKPGTKAPASSSGYTKPGSTPAPISAKAATFSSKSSFSKENAKQIQGEKSAASLTAYKADQDKFKGPKTESFDKSKYSGNGVYSNAPVYSGYNAKTQIEHRDNYYKKSSYQPPTYVYNTSPSFGAFDTMFLFWMMDSMSHNKDAQMMAHNYKNDPGMQEWRKQADEMAKTNTELKAKLEAMDKKLDETKGQPVDTKFVPKDIPAEVIVSATAMKAKTPAKPDLSFATGKKDGTYDLFGKVLVSNSKDIINLKLVETAGSAENLKLLLAGQVDMALVQSDVLGSVKDSLTSEQTVAYPEMLQLLAHKDSGISSISDLKDTNKVLFPKGSGSASSWAALCNDEPKFKKIKVDYIDSYAKGIEKVIKDKNSVLFLVAALNSPILQKADKTGKLRLASVYDDKLLKLKDSKGNPIYTYYRIDGDVYPNLQYRWWWFNKNIDTLATDAVLVLRADWVKRYGQDAFDALTLAFLETRTEITQKRVK
jgi:TRAP-type uncharacterized transport system substrate-binding protein